jgi:2',3'-cyclic-nucleotide 2'-phosphodiesterase (5'-nucleotidase family)
MKYQTIKARMFILALFLLIIGTWLTGCDRVKATLQTPKELVIVHTNDIEGALKPCSCLSDPAGGASRRATAMKTLRASNQTLLLVDGGDALYGTPVSDNTHGLSQVAVMNALQYDAAVLGDRDFQYGLDRLTTVVKSANFPFLSANILRTDTNQPLTAASTIITKGGQKIAIIGLTSPSVETIIASDQILASQIRVEDPIAIAKKLVPELQKEADLVVVLSHLGINRDKELASQVKGISIIIGAHNRKVINPPEILDNEIPLVQVGYQGDILGIERISYSGPETQVKIKNENISLNSSIESDQSMSALVAHYEALAAWNGNTSFADAIGATYPLDVAKASPEVKTAYGLVTAFPNLVMGTNEPLDKNDPSITLQKCFIKSLADNYQIEYSLTGINNKSCLDDMAIFAAKLPKQPAGMRIDPLYWSVD